MNMLDLVKCMGVKYMCKRKKYLEKCGSEFFRKIVFLFD